MNVATSSRSTSLGVPSGRAIPRRVTTIGPSSPAYWSATSRVWLMYIHIVELPSCSAGPARSGTDQRYVRVAPGATASSAFSAPEVPSSYGAPSLALS
ncbi:MAG TPA: hypothetical protein VHF89_05830 [Solirubrobacteraceae bacterium]|nr:hypothetical protein [Solirubrobacteraceae bacterium]